MRGTTGFRLLFVLTLLLVGCDRGIGKNDVAKAGKFALSIEEAAELLAPAADLPNDAGVVDAVAQYWTDYTLLAWAVNQEGELDKLDLSPLVDRRVAELRISRLRESVIQVDTTFTDEEVLARYEADRPGEEVSARHILFAYPTQVSAAQRDSIRSVAQGVLDRVRGGADFAQMARDYSEDPGSGPNGGDLGFFGRGMMVPTFEEGAFALQPGEVSDLIESDYGIHIIKVEARRLPAFAEIEESFRSQLAWETVTNAEMAYVQGVEAAANPALAEGAIEFVRRLAENVNDPLGRRDADRAIVTHKDGSYTGKDFHNFLVNQGPDLHQQIVTAPADQLEPFLLELTRGELLIADAAARGIDVSAEEENTFRDEFRAEYTRFAEALGLSGIVAQTGESLQDAVDREVMALMGRLIRSEEQVFPLGPLAFPLRLAYGQEVSEEAMDRAVTRIGELRASAPPPPALPEIPLPSESGAPGEAPAAAPATP